MQKPLTFEGLKANVTSLITANNLASSNFNVTRDNSIGLIDKIGLIVNLDTNYQEDKLAFMDDYYELPFGKTIEEWNEDLIYPIDTSLHNDEEALKDWTGSHRPATYSYTIGEKTIPQTIKDNDFNRAVNNAEQMASVVAIKTKRINDSMSAYRYAVKKEMVGKYIAKVESALGSGSAAFATQTAYNNGAYVHSGTDYGVVVNAIPANNTQTFAQLVTAGSIVTLGNMVEIVARPANTATGEAFIKAIKSTLEYAKDMNSGYALSGMQLGATEGLVLLINKGIIPSLEVDTMAGAFNKDELLTGVEMIAIDFGSYTGNAYAILTDRRTLRLHNSFRQTGTQRNEFKHFTNIFAHTEDTAFASVNTFVKVFKSA